VIGPGDLIAIVTFEGGTYPNLAVTREQLGRAQHAPHALGAALTHWLRRRHLWLEVRGRQIHGIATVRPLAGRDVWQVDTLIDTGDQLHPVIGSLLRQVQDDALCAGVSKLLLRIPVEAEAALEEVYAAGFEPALLERLWWSPGSIKSDVATKPNLILREADETDWLDRFQLYNRTLPTAARRSIAVTYDEWRSMLEEQWLGRRDYDRVVLENMRLIGAVRLGRSLGGVQLDLLATSREAAIALLQDVQSQHKRATPLLVLAPQAAGAVEMALAETGFHSQEEYVLLSRRIQKPVQEMETVEVGIAVPSGG
jgi:hypothetical protein